MFRDFMRQRLGLRDSMGSNTMDYQTPNEVPTGFNSNPFHPHFNQQGWPGHPMNGATLPAPTPIAPPFGNPIPDPIYAPKGYQPEGGPGGPPHQPPMGGPGATIPTENPMYPIKGRQIEGGQDNGQVGGSRGQFNPYAW